jgi:hypothetical protein
MRLNRSREAHQETGQETGREAGGCVMDRRTLDRQDLFDALTLRVSDVTERRQVLRVLGRVLLAMLVFGVFPWRVRAQEVTPESALVKGCKLPGQKCSGRGKNECCAKHCTGKGRCGCIQKGRTPEVDTPLGPVPVQALCCSNKLNKRTSECR